MRIAAHGVGGQTHLLKGGGHSRGNVADAVDLQRLRQGAPQGMVGMQRGVRILKHHLHVAPQIALKAGARRNGLAEQIHAAAPFALQSGQHAQNRRFAAARGADQAEGFPGVDTETGGGDRRLRAECNL